MSKVMVEEMSKAIFKVTSKAIFKVMSKAIFKVIFGVTPKVKNWIRGNVIETWFRAGLFKIKNLF